MKGQGLGQCGSERALSQTIFAEGLIFGRSVVASCGLQTPTVGRRRSQQGNSCPRKAYAFHFARRSALGDGVSSWDRRVEDSIYSFCVPSIANLYLRWWQPWNPERTWKPGQDPILGDHVDGFDNKVTASLVANPTLEKAGTN